MKIFEKYNSLLLYVILLIQFLKQNLCILYNVTDVDPSNVRIEELSLDKRIKHITLITSNIFNVSNSEREKLILTLKNNDNQIVYCKAVEEKYQDKENSNKIIFELDINQFLNKSKNYGKYELYNINPNYSSEKNIIYQKKTILIYFIGIKFNNPIHAYEITGESKVIHLKFSLSNEIEKEYINKITYISDSNLNIETNFNDFEFGKKDKKTLHLNFIRQTSPKNYTFYIYPEYYDNPDKNIVPKVYLHFQDYKLLTDAIYIRKNIQSSLVYFKVKFKSEDVINTFSIKENSANLGFKCTNLICEQLNCICEFSLGRKNQPGKITIEYIPKSVSSKAQNRDIFLILYESSMPNCYKKDDKVIDLEINTYMSSEMKYEHSLYFNDTARKDMTLYYEDEDFENSIFFKSYTAKSSSLNSGTFYLYSLIPDLTTNLDESTINNPVDDYSLYITIYPGKKLQQVKKSTIYTKNNTDQIIEINSIYAPAFDEIILKKIIANKTVNQIKISKTNGDCFLNTTNFTCNLKNMIYNYEYDNEGDYYVYYKSPCDTNEFLIEGRIITIEKGVNLISITPKYIFQDESMDKEINLEYDQDMIGKINNIFLLDIGKTIKDFPNNKTVNNKYVTFKASKLLDLGVYFIKTRLMGGLIYDNYDLSFRVIQRIKEFDFNHHFFVLNSNSPINRLVIKVNDTTNFGCMIEEASKHINLTSAGDCKTFYYEINRVGEIYFNYYYNDSNEKILIPIYKNIIVAPSYKAFFDFTSLKNCYYYKYNITMSFYNTLPKYYFFLNNEVNNISLIPIKENSFIKYTYNETKITPESIIDKKYYLIISEAYKDIYTYLYKSENPIGFTNIKVPEYIIKPNLTIFFDKIFCNLNESIIVMKKYSEPSLSKEISDCKFYSNNKTMTCKIQNTNFYNNNPFKNYSYTIDDQNILDDENNHQLTFVSNKLSDSSFICQFNQNNISEINVNIINNNCDFYFNLLSEVGFFIIKNKKNDSKISLLRRNDSFEGFYINEEKCSINFKINNGNFDLDINYIKRRDYPWEDDVGLSIYHYFNSNEVHIYNNTLFQVIPLVFLYNNYSLQKDSFKIYVFFKDKDIALSYTAKSFTNLKSCSIKIKEKENSFYYECMVNTSSFIPNEAQNFSIYIKDYKVDLDFIFYSLHSTSKLCKTKNDQIDDIKLIINIPNPKYKDLISLNSEFNMIINEPEKTNSQLIYLLKGNKINLFSPYFTINILGNQNYKETFSLIDLGLNIVPIYYMKTTNNDKNISFLPEDGQFLILDIYVKEDYIMDILNDIQYFEINGQIFDFGKINDNSINITLNLKWVNGQNSYELNYRDRCNHLINTNIFISVISFSLQRNYFVINNNMDNMDSQKLIIYGPYNDYIRIHAYKEGSKNGILANYNFSDGTYYLEFDESYEGDYTFVISNNGIELAKIKDKVYVVNDLIKLFRYENIPTCLFLDSNNEALKDININYKIITTNETKVKDISIFKSKYISDDNTQFNFEEEENGNTKTFTLESNYLKQKIYTNTEINLYLTEKDFIDQPLFVFKFNYTNITLNQLFSDVLYSDAKYIYFNMTCQIDNIDLFYLKNIKNNSIKLPIKCENYYKEQNNVYRCDLSMNDGTSNSLLKFGNEIDYYGYYNLIYTSNEYLISLKPFYLSYEIENIDFTFNKEKNIPFDKNTEIKMILKKKKIFYLKNIEKVNYNDDKGTDNPVNANFSFVFEDGDDEKYLYFQIFIEHRHLYKINEICRKKCVYCYNRNCWKNPNEYNVSSNIKHITFSFNRKYIAFHNSRDNNDLNRELIIEIGGDDAEKLKKVKYNYNSLYNDESESGNLTIVENNLIKKNDLKTGKYEFIYTVLDDEGEEENFNIDDVLLVAQYDYEIFDLSELKKKCFYYNEKESELYTSITSNKTYKFKEYVFDSDLLIIINNVEFESDNHRFKKNKNVILNNNNNNYKIKLKEKSFRNINLFFTTFDFDISVTSFDLNSSIPYFYKDNIVTIYQTCYLDNIYIREVDSDSKYYPLKYIYSNETNKKYYYETNYTFNTKNGIFQFYIGFPYDKNYIQLNLTKLIYNAIKDSNFSVSYNEIIVSIYSENFDMNNIESIRINNNTYINQKNFTKISNELIEFNYIKDSLNNSYVKELIRKNYYEDIDSVIKNKEVDLEMVEKSCGDLLVKYYSTCITCKSFSQTESKNQKRIWYENGECVEHCTFDKGYGISSIENKICTQCGTFTILNDTFKLCGCKFEGTVKSYLDGNCYLPESNEIKELIIQKPNTQCYLEDGKSDNYCKQNNTETCKPSSSSGVLFPECFCKKGFTGKYCELNESNIDLNNKMKEILTENNNDEINENSVFTISNIRGIIFFLEKDGSTYIKNINEDDINSYIQKSYNKLKSILKNNKTVSQIYDVLELAIYFLKYQIMYPKSIRNLQEDQEKLDYFVKNLHYVNYYGNKDLNQDYSIQADRLGLASFLTYKKSKVNSEDFKVDLSNRTLYRIMEYIDTDSINDNDNDDYVFVTLINKTLFKEFKGNDLGVRGYFSKKNNTIKLTESNNIKFYITSSEIQFNFQLAQYYHDRKINIYNKNDKAFIEPCYLSKLFDYDLTQKYRKNNIFQKKHFGSEESGCELISFESKYNTLLFNCTKFDKPENNTYLDIGILDINLNEEFVDNPNKVYNLPIRCTNKIDDLGGNIAFWFFLIICILEMFYIIGINILNLGSLKSISYRKGLIHDELYIHIPKKELEEDLNSNNVKLKPRVIKNGTKTIEFDTKYHDNVGIDKFYKSLYDCIILNFKELHPIAALCHVSIISPLIMHSWFFVFNTLTLFGFNALIYYEGLIEKRIYDKKRKNFDYPMRKEFHKIILSILCQVVLTVLIKLLMIVWLKQREELKMSLTKCTLKYNESINADIVFKVEQFQKQMLFKRLLGALLMLFIVIFFFYYSVVFCGIYVKTQFNWFYSGIWSLFWNWVIFAPIYILVISIIEYKKENSFDPLVYNLKRLFCF